MSFAAARTDVVTAMEAAMAAWSGDPFPVEWPNKRNVNVERLQAPYLALEVHYVDGAQLSMGRTKVLADYGQIHITACVPDKAGELKILQLQDHIRTFFELKSFSTIRTHASMGAEPKPEPGWKCFLLVIPFWIHRLVTSD